MEAEAIKMAAYDKRGQMAAESEYDKDLIKDIAKEAEDYAKKLNELGGSGNGGLPLDDHDLGDLDEDDVN